MTQYPLKTCLLLLCTMLAGCGQPDATKCRIDNTGGSPHCVGSIGDNRLPQQAAPDSVGSLATTGIPQTELVRITSPVGDAEADTHRYSKRQVWNSDESMIMLKNSIIDANDFHVIVDQLPISSASNWSNHQPGVVIGIRYNDELVELVEWNVTGGEVGVIRAFPTYRKCTFGSGEGSMSNDDMFIVLACENVDDGKVQLVSIDLSTNRILGTLTAEHDYNWASFSQSGEFIMVENNKSGENRRQLLRYAPDFSARHLLSNRVEHGDLGIDASGDDVYVMTDQRFVFYIRLRDGKTAEYPLNRDLGRVGFGHVSCRNIGRPGWCYISTYGNRTIAAVRLNASYNLPRPLGILKQMLHLENSNFQIWGYHNASIRDYAASARAVVSPSGRAVLFTSHWDGTAPNSSYVLRLKQSAVASGGSNTSH